MDRKMLLDKEIRDVQIQDATNIIGENDIAMLQITKCLTQALEVSCKARNVLLMY